MIKNILIIDVVHHLRDILTTWYKRALPKVTFPSLSTASCLLNDAPHHSAIPSYQKKLGRRHQIESIFVESAIADSRDHK